MYYYIEWICKIWFGRDNVRVAPGVIFCYNSCNEKGERCDAHENT